jgi:hypothetical protein
MTTEGVTWSEVLDHISAAFTAGYGVGFAHGRNDRAEDEQHVAAHELACRTIGLGPFSDDAPPWSVAS